MPVSKASPASGEPEEWAYGAKLARFARGRTAERLSEMIVDTDLTGSKDYVRRRLATLIEAERTGDPLVIHEASMELAAASAAYAVALQLRTPVFSSSLRAELANGNGNGNGNGAAVHG